MNSRRLRDLLPHVQPKAAEVIDECGRLGVELLVTCTYRSPEEQARLYRQSRTITEIRSKAEQYSNGYGALADILWSVGPQYGRLGRHVTNAGPGESWHNYGQAMDVVILIDGKPCWDDEHPAWETYGKVAEKVGFTWAGRWVRFRELPHIQQSKQSNPLQLYTPAEYKEALDAAAKRMKT